MNSNKWKSTASKRQSGLSKNLNSESGRSRFTRVDLMYESGPDVTRVVLMYEYRRSKTNSTVIRIKLDCPPSILTLNRNPYSQVTRTLILNLPARGKSMILPSYFPNMLFTQTVIYKFSKFNSIFLDDLLTILETVQYHIFRPSRSIRLD